MIRACLATKGGRLDGTEKVLWVRDMTDEEYDRYFDSKQKELDKRTQRVAE